MACSLELCSVDPELCPAEPALGHFDPELYSAKPYPVDPKLCHNTPASCHIIPESCPMQLQYTMLYCSHNLHHLGQALSQPSAHVKSSLCAILSSDPQPQYSPNAHAKSSFRTVSHLWLSF